MNKRALLLLGWTVLFAGCASRWKIHGGPQECIAMCRSWNLQFAGMVGVGNQDATGEGATACVCQVAAPVASVGLPGGAATASMAGPITAAQAAAAATLAHQRQMQMQQQRQQTGGLRYH